MSERRKFGRIDQPFSKEKQEIQKYDIAVLRELLSRNPSAETWEEIVKYFYKKEGRKKSNELEMAQQYASAHLDNWGEDYDDLRLFPSRLASGLSTKTPAECVRVIAQLSRSLDIDLQPFGSFFNDVGGINKNEHIFSHISHVRVKGVVEHLSDGYENLDEIDFNQDLRATITDGGELTDFLTCAQFTHLKSLSIQDVNIRESVEHWSSIDSSSLEEIDLSFARISPDGAKQLAEMNFFDHVKYLSIAGGADWNSEEDNEAILDEGFSAIAAKLKNIEELCIQGSGIGDHSIRTLVNEGSIKNLKFLDLSFNYQIGYLNVENVLSPDGFEILFSHKDFSAVEILRLSSTEISVENIQTLGASTVRLREFDLSDTKANNSLREIASGEAFSELRVLVVNDTIQDEEDFVALFDHGPQLEYLGLGMGTFESAYLQYAAQSNRLEKLKVLRIGTRVGLNNEGRAFNDSDFQNFIENAYMPNLEQLGLWFRMVNIEQFKLLAANARFMLKGLDVNRSGLGEMDLELVEDFSGFKELEELDIGNILLSPSSILHLKENLPKLKRIALSGDTIRNSTDVVLQLRESGIKVDVQG